MPGRVKTAKQLNTREIQPPPAAESARPMPFCVTESNGGTLRLSAPGRCSAATPRDPTRAPLPASHLPSSPTASLLPQRLH